MDEIFKLLNPDNTVMLNRPLAHELGINEAIIYSALAAKQAYYEQRGMLDEDGWFYSTVNDLEESTAKARQYSGWRSLVLSRPKGAGSPRGAVFGSYKTPLRFKIFSKKASKKCAN